MEIGLKYTFGEIFEKEILGTAKLGCRDWRAIQMGGDRVEIN